jgi:nicotinamide-nucleotide amidase
MLGVSKKGIKHMTVSHKINRAEIISIGDELLIGQVVNSNAAWMGEQLFLNGISLHWITTVGDTEEAIHQALHNALDRSQFIFLTGGLGPTSDDITKTALCSFFDVPLVFNQQAYDQIVALFSRRGFPLTERNRLQAMLPSNCTAIANQNGTASGMWFEYQDSIIVSMPGVPFEMKPMFEKQLLPTIKSRFNVSSYLFKTVMTTGVGESFLADRIREWEQQLPSNFRLAYLPQPGIVRLRIGGQDSDKEKVRHELNNLVAGLQQLIPEFIYGYDNQSLEEVVGSLLSRQGKTVATAESCTGGYIAHLLTSIAGSSTYFKGSVVAYANEIKTALLGVPQIMLLQYGAVSQQVAEAMAIGLRKRFETDFAVAVTGIAGPDGGTIGKPVGTVWIAVADKTGVQSSIFHLGDLRMVNIRRAALAALNMLRLELVKKD